VGRKHHIPRPRHLFPELALFLIIWRRAEYYFFSGVQSALGHVPVWIAGSMAGVSAILLAISLFFIRDPELQAASQPVVEPVPVFQPVYQPTPAPVIPWTPPQIEQRRGFPLVATLERTILPYRLDEERLTTTTSQARPLARQQTFLNDRWHVTAARSKLASAFASYLLNPGLPGILNNPLLASDTVPLQFAPPASKSLGVIIEKPDIESAIPGVPLTYEIIVINVSPQPIERLIIRERLSEIQRVTEVVPSAAVDSDQLVWNFPGFEAGGIKTLKVTLMPEQAGRISTETSVLAASQVSADVNVQPQQTPRQQTPNPVPIVITPSGSPLLKLSYTTVQPLTQGDVLSMTFSVTNVGTAPAENVLLYVRLSGELEHRYGENVQHRIGTLKPGETRRALLQAMARNPGAAKLDAALTMGGTTSEARELTIPIRAEPQSSPQQETAPGTSASPSHVWSPVSAAPTGMWMARQP